MWKSFGIVTLASLGLTIAACDRYDPVREVGDQDPVPERVSLEEVAENVDDYLGGIVTVTGFVSEVYGTSAFQIRNDDEILERERIVIIGLPDTDLPSEGDTVQVTGEVRELVIAKLTSDYDIRWQGEVMQQLKTNHGGEPVIMARLVESVDP